MLGSGSIFIRSRRTFHIHYLVIAKVAVAPHGGQQGAAVQGYIGVAHKVLHQLEFHLRQVDLLAVAGQAAARILSWNGPERSSVSGSCLALLMLTRR